MDKLYIVFSDRNVRYQLKFKRQAIKDLKALPLEAKERILAKIVAMQDNLQGDIKKLTNFTPEYRLRVGKYRILFRVDSDTLRIY